MFKLNLKTTLMSIVAALSVGAIATSIASIVVSQEAKSSMDISSEQGMQGPQGEKGNGIASIILTSRLENVDTYTINFTDGTTTTFTVTNGKDGAQGIQGEQGPKGDTPVINVGENGNWFIDGEDSGVKAVGVDGLTPYVGENGNWFIGEIDTNISAQGPQGDSGKDGLTPYIGENGNWRIGNNDTNISAQGAQGDSGKDGLTPYIGENGNWRIGDTDTKVKAEGKDGSDGNTPYIGENGNWWIGDNDLGVQAQGAQGDSGKDGLTPYIGENGNWRIGETDTKVKAEGKDGKTPIIEIGENGNWFIDGVDSDVNAYGAASVYKVTLDANGGTMPEGSTLIYQVQAHETILDLPEPTRSGYNFIGWYVDEGINEGKFTSTTPVTQDITLYAHWESKYADFFTVTWLNYDGSILEKDYEVRRGTYPSYDGKEPTKPSTDVLQYNFAGWSPELSYVENDVTYVAQFNYSDREFALTFHIGKYGSIDNSIVSGKYGELIDEPNINLDSVPNDIIFEGWYFDELFTQRVGFPYVIKSDAHLYAKWTTIEDVSYRLTYYYDESLDGYVVKSYNEDLTRPAKAISIPSIWDDGKNGKKNVVGIGTAFRNNPNLLSIELPNTIKYIYDYAFYNTVLENINLPESMISIGSYAFSKSNIVNVNFGANIVNIGEYAFYQSKLSNADLSLTKINTINSHSFAESDITNVVLPNTVVDIGSYGFYSCKKLVNLNLNEGLTKISKTGFSNCISLKEVVFPSTMIEIENSVFDYDAIRVGAFSGCISLEKLELNEGLKAIGGLAFLSCYSLKSVVVPDSVDKIADGTFNGCSALEEIVLPDTIETIEDWAFAYTNLKTFNMPKNLKSIGSNVFYENHSLKEVNFNNSLEIINSNAFCFGPLLEKIELPDSVRIIGNGAFSCSSLKVVILPAGVEQIGNAFYGASDLTIYCKASQKPESGWSDDFYGNGTVYWYSETEPTDITNNYWHYSDDGEPWKW